MLLEENINKEAAMSFRNSGMITFRHEGDFDKTESFLNKIKNFQIMHKLDKYGKKGVDALAAATPKDTGKTANSWGYEISQGSGEITIAWTNSNVNKDVNVAVILQYGHGTKNGGYVRGIDYINPAIKPIFEDIVNDIWKEVTA